MYVIIIIMHFKSSDLLHLHLAFTSIATKIPQTRPQRQKLKHWHDPDPVLSFDWLMEAVSKIDAKCKELSIQSALSCQFG